MLILILHILAGSTAILSGMATLIPKKGSRLHIMLGSAFFYSMLLMTGGATFLAIFSEPSRINGTIAIFTAYLVLTGRWTANNHSGNNTIREKIGAFSALILFGVFLFLSIDVTSKGATNEAIDGVPAEAYYAYTLFAALALSLDLKVLIKGGVYGAQRVARHLWRMIFALFIATASLFLGQSQVFPEVLQTAAFLSAPVLLVVLALFVWLIRVYVVRRFKLKPKRI